MEVAQNRQISILFFLIGLVSGTVSWQATEQFHFSLADGWINEFALVGVVFGAFVGTALLRLRAASVSRVAVFLVACEISWLSAYYCAKYVAFDLLLAADYQMTVVGLTAGLLGAALLSLCCACIFPFYRASNRFCATVLLGSVIGGTLGLEDLDSFPIISLAILFPAWQSTFAYRLGRTIPCATDGGPGADA